MMRRDSKPAIFILDLFLRLFFLIPVIIERLVRKDRAGLPQRILIIELWGIGDLVMMSGILKPLKEALPGAKITLLSKETAKTLFAAAAPIDNFVSFDFPWTSFRRKYEFWKWDWPWLLKTIVMLRRERFDLILDARGDIRNNLLSFFIDGKRRFGYNWTGGGFLLTDCLYSASRNLHRIEGWFGLLGHLGIAALEPRTALDLSQQEENAASDFLAANNIKEGDLLVGIHPGARIKERCWPLDNFAGLAVHLRDKFQAKILVFVEPQGYPQDIPIDGEFLKVKVSLRQMAAIIKRLDLLICNDSGPMHIATAVGTKTISVFGPGDIAKIGPYGKGHTVIMDRDIDCRPCFDYCRYDKPACLENISVESVIEAAARVLLEVISGHSSVTV